jgi:hypothetical protein
MGSESDNRGVRGAAERDDAFALIRPRIDRWTSASWEELDRLEGGGEVEEEAVAPSGKRYRVRTYAFWDMEPWESGMYVIVKVYGRSGWRKRWPYKGAIQRGDADDWPEEPVSGTRWVKEGGRWRLRE